MKKKGLILFFLLFLPVSTLMANGFKNFAWGAQGTALAGAWVAGAEGAASIFYNPAGMVNLEGSGIYVGGFYTSRQFSFFSPDKNLAVESENKSFLLPSLAYSRQVSNKIWLGFGIYSPSSYKITWPFNQRHPLVYGARNIDLMVYNISPGIAWRVSDRLSFGLNLGVNFSSAELRTHYDYDMIITNLTSGMVMDAEDFILTLKDCQKISLAFTLGLQWRIFSKLTFGLTVYGDLFGKHRVGWLEFKETDTPFLEINEFLASHFRDSPEQKANFYYWDIPSIKAGLAWQVNDSFSLELAVYYDIWYALDAAAVVLDPAINWPGSLWLKDIEENYECVNTFSFRIGGEYRLAKAFQLRMGAFLDPNPMPDDTYSPAFPFSDQRGAALGFGYRYKRLSVDLAYRLLIVEDKKVSNDVLELWGIRSQEYAGRSEHLFSIGIGYRLK